MKFKTSVALDEETIIAIRELVREGRFRNKSHAMEYSINRLLNEIRTKESITGLKNSITTGDNNG